MTYKILILAEKNSIAKEIINSLDCQIVEKKTATSASIFYTNKNIVVCSSGGHITENGKLPLETTKYEDIPVLLNQLKDNVIKEKASIIKELKKIAKDFEKVVHYGDCGQEGELIQRLLINQLNFKTKNFYRAWYSEITPKALKKAYETAEPLNSPKYQNLYHAGESRRITDFLIGLNYTFLTRKGIGRVMTPIIKAVYDRCLAQKEHKKTPFYYLKATTQLLNHQVSFKSKNIEENIFENINKSQYLSIDYTNKEIYKQKKELHNLNSLQIELGKYYKPKKTLEIAQKLYEKGIITYPRTEETKLSPNDNTQVIHKIFNQFAKDKDIYELNTKNNKLFLKEGEVPDHTAIIPTEKSINQNISEFSIDEKTIFLSILNRFLINFSKDALIYQLNAKININHENENHELTAKLEAIIEKGYLKNELTNKEESYLPINDIKKIQEIRKSNFSIENITEFTKPAPLFTESSMIKWLEKDCRKEVNKEAKKDLPSGIGTVATRANILEKCIVKEYILIEKNKLLISKKGIEYCEKLLQLDCKRITSPELTASMENALQKIRTGELSKKNYQEKLEKEITTYCEKLKKNYKANRSQKSDLSCPTCGNPLIMINKAVFCEKKHIYLPKVLASTKIEKYFKELLQNKKTTEKIQFTSKSKKTFQCLLILENKEKEWSLKFFFSEKKSSIICPDCKDNFFEYDSYIKCKNCNYSLPNIYGQQNITNDQQKLINGETIYKNFISKNNKPYFAYLNYEKNTKKLKLEFSN